MTVVAPSGDDDSDGENALERIEAEVSEIARATTDMPMEFRRMVELLRRGSFSGPLPPPEILEGYRAAYPEAPAIIFGELVKQGGHRREMESTALTRQERRADRGQIFALVIVLAALAVGLVAIRSGQGWVAVGLFGASLVGIASLFIYGTKRQVADLREKRGRIERVAAPDQPDDDADSN